MLLLEDADAQKAKQCTGVSKKKKKRRKEKREICHADCHPIVGYTDSSTERKVAFDVV